MSHAFLDCYFFINMFLLQNIRNQKYHHSVKQFDPDQARHDVGPDLGPNRLQRLSVGTSRQRVKDNKMCNISPYTK